VLLQLEATCLAVDDDGLLLDNCSLLLKENAVNIFLVVESEKDADDVSAGRDRLFVAVKLIATFA
jgi:hypothetical protein